MIGSSVASAVLYLCQRSMRGMSYGVEAVTLSIAMVTSDRPPGDKEGVWELCRCSGSFGLLDTFHVGVTRAISQSLAQPLHQAGGFAVLVADHPCFMPFGVTQPSAASRFSCHGKTTGSCSPPSPDTECIVFLGTVASRSADQP